MERGKFIVVDGLDGIGKSVIESALLEGVDGEVFDSVRWSKENPSSRPDVSLVGDCKVVLSAEPSYSGVGLDIRNTLISNSKEVAFSYELLVAAYSLDRGIQMRNFILPVLERGVDVVQSRCVASSLCYQTLSAENEGLNLEIVRKRILKSSGNIFQLKNAPDLLIIPVIKDVDDLINRLKSRRKKDDSIFEKADFLKRVKVCYESDWLRRIFEKAGTKVAYLDAGISIEDTRSQVLAIYDSWISTGKIPKKFRKILGS